MYCTTKQYLEIIICVPQNRPHGASGLVKHYYMSFDPKLGHGICEICRIPCAYTEQTSTLDKI